ncbi:PKD domain containing protein [Luedemannella helvata]|uniref:PKD domain containing protein n=1 Tax=Luedemannella helvata TaxID=349315 RepID=A0ABP4X336_9ACTN
MRWPTAILAATLAVTWAGAPAHADTRQPAVVSADPVDWTPHVLDGTVRAVARLGSVIVVGGDFGWVQDARTGRARRQPYLFAFHARTGALLPFRPRLDGPVLALAAGPAGTVLAGGSFRHVDRAPRRGLARLRLANGRAVPEFRATIDSGDVRALIEHRGEVYVGGTFTAIGGWRRTGLARVLATTGAVDEDLRLDLSARELTRVKVEDLALSPAGDRLVAVGAITRVAGQVRAQLAMINTGVRPAKLAPWFTNVYARACREGFDTYLRGVDFAPDGSYFVVVSTGRLGGAERMCDTAARFETSGAGEHRPTWVNHTGGDSLYTVSVTGAAVYVGGHQRWMNNTHGYEAPGPGAVFRPGISALHPRTGRALPWNPTRSRGVGVRAMLATPDGLILGSDTDQLGGEYHARVGMFPLP